MCGPRVDLSPMAMRRMIPVFMLLCALESAVNANAQGVTQTEQVPQDAIDEDNLREHVIGAFKDADKRDKGFLTQAEFYQFLEDAAVRSSTLTVVFDVTAWSNLPFIACLCLVALHVHHACAPCREFSVGTSQRMTLAR